MKAFVAVAEHAGFTAASRQLGVDQALITRQVADLENHLGVKLLERTTRSVRLTEAGEVFLHRCRSILSDITDAEAEVSRSHQEMMGRVRIGIPTAFSIKATAEELTKLHKEFPDLQIEIAMTDHPIDPVAESFDVVTMNANHHVSLNAVARPFLQVPFVLCASDDYLKQHKAPATPADLKHHYCVAQWISGDADHSREVWTLENAAGGQENITVAVALRTNSYGLSLEAVRSGLGIGRLPLSLAAQDIHEGRLQLLLSDWQAGELPIKLVYPGRRMIPKRVRHVIDSIFAQRDEAVSEESV